MRTSVVPRSHQLSEAAERQMRMWALRLETQQREPEHTPPPSPQQLIHPYIAISRECGIDAAEIARLVADKSRAHLFDRELLDYMAEHYQWSQIALEYVDERTASWLHDTFGKWLDSQLVSQAEYVSRLGRVVLLAAQHESTVFVGRGAQFILPREAGVAVRLIAPRGARVERIIERRQLSRTDAEKFIDDVDRGRADFIRRYFHRDVADPHLYDLVINLEHIKRDAAANLIADLYRRRATAM